MNEIFINMLSANVPIQFLAVSLCGCESVCGRTITARHTLSKLHKTLSHSQTQTLQNFPSQNWEWETSQFEALNGNYASFLLKCIQNDNMNYIKNTLQSCKKNISRSGLQVVFPKIKKIWPKKLCFKENFIWSKKIFQAKFGWIGDNLVVDQKRG